MTRMSSAMISLVGAAGRTVLCSRGAGLFRRRSAERTFTTCVAPRSRSRATGATRPSRHEHGPHAPVLLVLEHGVAARPVLQRELVRRQERRVQLALGRVLQEAGHVLLP